MLSNTLPVEYQLEQPAKYDEYRLRQHIKGCLTVFPMKKLRTAGKSLLLSFFETTEHRELALDILEWIFRKEEDIPDDIVIKSLMLNMYESGFFG